MLNVRFNSRILRIRFYKQPCVCVIFLNEEAKRETQRDRKRDCFYLFSISKQEKHVLRTKCRSACLCNCCMLSSEIMTPLTHDAVYCIATQRRR